MSKRSVEAPRERAEERVAARSMWWRLREPLSPWRAKLVGALAVLAAAAVWGFVTWGSSPETRLVSPVVLPSPAEVAMSAGSLMTERALGPGIAATLWRVILGFGLAVLVGIPLGVVAGSWRVLDAAAAPIALFGRNIPIAALIPLTILWFGIGETQKVMFIFLACAPFVFSGTVQAIISVPGRYVDTAQTLGARSRQVVVKVLLPLALPEIYVSLRSLFGLAFGYIMLAELINAKHGLGYLLSTSQRRGLTEHIILILFVIGALAYGIDRLLYAIQRGLFPYQERSE